jgi:hypothetical protein
LKLARCTPLSSAWCYPLEHTVQGCVSHHDRSHESEATGRQATVTPPGGAFIAGQSHPAPHRASGSRREVGIGRSHAGLWVLSSTQHVARMLYSLQLSVRLYYSTQAGPWESMNISTKVKVWGRESAPPEAAWHSRLGSEVVRGIVTVNGCEPAARKGGRVPFG